jgi:hypothetical protein
MNNSFARLIDGMNATLRKEVVPRLDDEFARGQVFGVINLLNTFKVRADWSSGFLREQIAAQCQALDGIVALVGRCPDAPSLPALPAGGTPQTVSVAALLTMREDNNRAISALLDWLDAQRAKLPSGLAQDIEQRLLATMREELAIELRNSPRPLFAEMSSGTEEG